MNCADIMKSNHIAGLPAYDDEVITISSLWSCDFCASCDVIFHGPDDLAETSMPPVGKRMIRHVQITDQNLIT
jgi:hypothetical protein